MSFLETMKQRAKQTKKTIVLPESLELRTLKATDIILREGLADIILVGKKAEILEKAEGLNLDGATIIDPHSYDHSEKLVVDFAEMRKSKGMTIEEARKIVLDDPLYFGVMLVNEGLADGMVAGAINSTANVLRPALQILKTKPGTKHVSSFFVMVVPDCELGNKGVFVFADCALTQNPTSEELAAIAISSAESYKQFVGEEPVVAMLSHSTKGSAKHADIDKVVEATKIVKAECPELAVDGEFQLDAAIVPSVGKQKAPDSPAAGQANVLVFPDLDAGNIGYKLVQRLAKAEAYGPITQGIRKPVNDLSRGASVEDIVGVVVLTAVQIG